MTQDDLIDYIKRSLGYPMIKIELMPDHIIDCINRAVFLYKKWTLGNATQEVYFTMPLIPGTSLYKMPDGVLDIIDYESKNYATGINTLFTIENYFFSQGMFNGLKGSSSGAFSLVDLHIVKEFLETLNRYTSDKYIFQFHKVNKTLELRPVPETDHYILVKAIAPEGWFIGVTDDELNEYLYDNPWIQDYALALTKVKLGYVRRKFGNFSSIGNTGLALDGSELIQEGNEALVTLEEKLKLEETYEGWDFVIG